MGDKLLVSLNEDNIQLPAFAKVIATRTHIDLSDLAFQSTGHCDHSDSREDIHPSLDKIFSTGQFNLISTDNIKNRVELLTHKQISPFEKNKVLVYQYQNRLHTTLLPDAQVESLLTQVDKDRWYSQVEYLASFDRMSDSGLVAAGEWLESEFQNLGLETSRIDLSGYRGFNVLGFKQGVSKPDDWYVVGAHLDSRNANWDDGKPSPGAEDNASGCSGVLEIANVISQYETESSIMFMCFNAEERGLLGSAEIVNLYAGNGNLTKIQAMLNMDMIAYRLGSKNIAVTGTNRSAHLDLVNTIAENGSLYTEIDWQSSLNMCCTDFVSFSNAHIPAATSNQPDISSYFGYHSVNDLPENLDPVLGSGVIKANLATLANMVGVNYQAAVGFDITPAHTGTWYNTDQSGHGLSIEILSDNRIVAFWFVYDDAGNQVWLVGIGTYEGATANLDVMITDSGVFPPYYISDDMVSTSWGSFQFEFIDCNTVNFSWIPVAYNGYAAGSLQMTRLTNVAGLTCEE